MPIRQRDRTARPATEEALADRPAFDGFATAAGPVPARRPGEAAPPAQMPGRQATHAATRQALRNARQVAGMAMTAEAAAQRDVISDEEAARIAGYGDDAFADEGIPEPRTPEMLPAVISRAVAETGDGLVHPQWHMVRNLPGYLREPIRALGRPLFSQFTDTPLEDIQILTTILNPDRELQALAGWIRRNGIMDDDPEIDFDRVFPGYKVKPQIWNVEGYTFLLMEDFAGRYIYGWPGGRGVHLENEPPRPMLR